MTSSACAPSGFWLGLAVLVAAGGPLPAAQKVDFARDVLPILSDSCFPCHGPDQKTRRAGLRLDTREGLFRQKKKRTMVVPGKSDHSEVIRRVTSKDAEEVMPPPDSNRKLTPRQIETLKKWVEEGARWEQHWAFVPLPRMVPVPAVRDSAWAKSDIDRFILARLEKEGLKPSPEATREAWLRRVTLDLTGLPPAPADIDAFTRDTRPDAYEKVIDRLLDSGRYGERMAADWLDIARYADTHGYQMDRARSMWVYRDWVVRAFNRNLPFADFLTWQLAGDLLPRPTKEQRLATAFNRLHMQNEEGGIVEEEFRVAYVVDRVNTMGTAFLGLTFECCRCHDHKFDPVSMKEFYSLFAFFQNIDEAGQTTYFTTAMPVPTLLLSSDEQDARLATLAKQITQAEADLKAERKKAQPAFLEWLKRRGKLPETPGLAAAFSFDDWKNNRVSNSVNPKQPGVARDNPKPVPGKVGQAAELSGENGFDFPQAGHFSRVDPFTLSLWVRSPAHVPRAVVVHHSKAPVDAGSRGYELLLENGRVALGLHHMWPGNSLKVRTRKAIAVNTWAHITATYDGSSRAAGVHLYIDGIPAEVEAIRDGLWKDITYGGGEPNLAIGFRFRDNGFKGGVVDEFRVYNRALTTLEVADLAGKDDLKTAWATDVDGLSAEQRGGLFELFLATAHEPARKLSAHLHSVRRDHNRTINPIPEAMVMKELATPKPAFVLKRGAYDARGERVTMNTPAALPSLPADAPRNRLGLARWLTHPDHPLTARVTVNRLWQQMFGRGIVETSDNFGSTGSPPTHPELLDWLARDFVRDGWDVKRFLRRIALSATYRQAAHVTPEMLAKDPYNHLLARAPARRLTAEMLRDQALFVSGLLVETQGGPSVYPYQPEGLWNEAMGRPHYPRSQGSNLYRRSLYTFWKRTAPHPQMTTFDAADRSVCSARRQATSTPLQALALLNDPQMVEAARFLGQRMLKEGGRTPEQQVAWVFRVVIGREPTRKEATILERLFEEQKADFAKDSAAVEKLLSVGASKPDATMSKTDLAAAASVALAILNHDGAVYRR
jgi:hypothetical protein